MHPALRLPALGLFALALPAAAQETCTAPDWADCAPVELALEPLVAGDQSLSGGIPTGIVFGALVPEGPEHVFVARKDGTVTVSNLTSGLSSELISLDGVASVNPERGLLGLALAPNFATSHTLYTVHTEPRTEEANAACRYLPPGRGKQLEEACAKGEEFGCGGAFVVTEWTFPSILLGAASEGTSREVFRRNQPGEGHNAGHALFGPDGMLYVSVGDGGSQMDPCSRGQDVTDVYATILRLDPSRPDGVAEGNPLASTPDAEPAIWAYGLRNPWRMDFVPEGLDGVPAGTLLVGDTGQSRAEEVNVVVPGGNYGWSVREGTLMHPKPHPAPASPDFVNPLHQYGSLKGRGAPTGGAAIVGGVVYAGSALPDLRGYYLFGDNVSGTLWALDLSAHDLTEPSSWTGSAKVHLVKGASVTPATFARDGAGEVYVGGSGGQIWRVVAPAE